MVDFYFFTYPPGSSLLNDEYLSNDYEIESKSEKKVKGTFWIKPSLSDVKIDINNIVELKYYTAWQDKITTYDFKKGESYIIYIIIT